MWRYMVAHWQGAQSLPRSVFLNGLLVYLLFVLAAGLAETFTLRGGPVVWVFLGAMLIWLVWAIVGVVRGGWRILADPGVSGWRKLGAVVALLGAAAFAVVSGHDLYRIFLVRPAPTSPGVQAATLASPVDEVDFDAGRLKMASDGLLRTSRPPPAMPAAPRTARP